MSRENLLDLRARMKGGASAGAEETTAPESMASPPERKAKQRRLPARNTNSSKETQVHIEEQHKMLSTRIPLSLHQDLEEMLLRSKRRMPKMSMQDAMQSLITILLDDPKLQERLLSVCRQIRSERER